MLGKERERERSSTQDALLFFFYLLDLTGQSWAVLFFSWR